MLFLVFHESWKHCDYRKNCTSKTCLVCLYIVNGCYSYHYINDDFKLDQNLQSTLDTRFYWFFLLRIGNYGVFVINTLCCYSYFWTRVFSLYPNLMIEYAFYSYYVHINGRDVITQLDPQQILIIFVPYSVLPNFQFCMHADILSLFCLLQTWYTMHLLYSWHNHTA